MSFSPITHMQSPRHLDLALPGAAAANPMNLSPLDLSALFASTMGEQTMPSTIRNLDTVEIAIVRKKQQQFFTFSDKHTTLHKLGENKTRNTAPPPAWIMSFHSFTRAIDKEARKGTSIHAEFVSGFQFFIAHGRYPSFAELINLNEERDLDTPISRQNFIDYLDTSTPTDHDKLCFVFGKDFESSFQFPAEAYAIAGLEIPADAPAAAPRAPAPAHQTHLPYTRAELARFIRRESF